LLTMIPAAFLTVNIVKENVLENSKNHFVKAEIDLKKPATYNLVLSVSFDPSYVQDYLSVVFTVFDNFLALAFLFSLKTSNFVCLNQHKKTADGQQTNEN